MPKSAINAHIAAARRAAQAALTESAGKDRNPKQAAESTETGERAHAAVGGQAKAFFAARRRPILLGATLLALIATLAVVELRGGRQAAMQKSDLEAPAQRIAKPDVPKLGSLSGGNDAGAIDPNPVGSIAAPPTPAKSARPPPRTSWRQFRPACRNPCARPRRRAIPTPSSNWRCASSRAAASPRIRTRPRNGSSRRPFAICPSRSTDWPRSTKRASASRAILQLAMSWYTKAATAGNARAMHNLAVMNAEGAAGGKPDYAEAAQWFRKAGQLGIRDSQFNLGILYARGMGVPQDLVQSWLWFSLAAQQGDADAAKKRDEVAAKMDAPALLAAAKALAEFKASTPSPAANEAPAPPGGWDAKSAAPQASQTPPRPRAPARPLSKGARSAGGLQRVKVPTFGRPL